MSTLLVSLREAADDSNAGKCYLQTVVTVQAELEWSKTVKNWNGRCML